MVLCGDKAEAIVAYAEILIPGRDGENEGAIRLEGT